MLTIKDPCAEFLSSNQTSEFSRPIFVRKQRKQRLDKLPRLEINTDKGIRRKIAA